MIALLVAGAGCAKPYNPPTLEEPTKQDSQDVDSFDGLRTRVRELGTLRVLWAHGMCSHKKDWAQRRARAIEFALYGEARGIVPDPTDLPGGAKSYTYDFPVDDGVLSIDMLLWSPLTAPYKERLEFDARENDPKKKGQFPYERAKLNNQLKVGLLNDCLADAVVYLGPNGEPLRDLMRREVCRILDGSYTSDLSKRPIPWDCHLSIVTETVPLAFVTESLGSKLLLQAVRQIWEAEVKKVVKANPGLNPSAVVPRALAQRLATTHLLMLVSNQVPLLDQGDYPLDSDLAATAGTAAGERPSSLGLFSRYVTQSRERTSRDRGVDRQNLDEAGEAVLKALGIPLQPLTVVSFTDPNDLLSYRLIKESPKLDDTRLVSVIVSNANTYFGYVEHPAFAHCDYATNAFVLGLVLNGYVKGEALPEVTLDASADSCLGD